MGLLYGSSKAGALRRLLTLCQRTEAFANPRCRGRKSFRESHRKERKCL
jgi:hypothetical protein